MNPQGTPEHNSQAGEQLPTPDPVRAETLADLDTARNLLHSTGCSPEEYNSCTENFETQREQCRTECIRSRTELLKEVELQNKDISELTADEAKQLLTLSQTEYQNYKEQSNVGKGLSAFRNLVERKNSYANVGARKEMNEFQEALIKKILGEDTLSQGFNEDNVLGYNNTIGNHIIDLSSFENDLKQKAPNDWNSQALVNYLGKLLAMGPINITTIIHTFGASQLVRLQHEWTKETAGPAKQKLQEIQGISWLIDGINSIDYSSLLQNPDGFREVAQIFDELSNEEKESIIENAIDYFIENPELIEQINLTGNKEGVFDTSIMKARNIILAKEYSASLAAEYIGGPEVADILEAIMVVGAEGNGQGFDFSGINEIIEDYNKENDTNYSLIDSSKQAHILETIQSLSEASMLSENYGTKIQQLRSLQDTLKSLYSQRANLFARLKTARNMQESEAEEALLSDIGNLDREIYNTRGDIGRLQEQVENIEGEVDERQGKIQMQAERFQRIKESRIQHDLSNQQAINDIRRSPESHFQKISTLESYNFFVSNFPDDFKELGISKVNLRLINNSDNFYSIITSFPGKVDRLSQLDSRLLLSETYEDSIQYEGIILNIIKKGGYRELKRRLQTFSTEDTSSEKALRRIHEILKKQGNKDDQMIEAETDLNNYLLEDTDSINSENIVQEARALLSLDDYTFKNHTKNRIIKFFASPQCDVQEKNVQEALQILISSGNINPYDISINLLENTSTTLQIGENSLPIACLFLQSVEDIGKNFHKLPHSVQINPSIIGFVFQVFQSSPNTNPEVALKIIEDINIYSWSDASKIIDVITKIFPEGANTQIEIPPRFIDTAIQIIENLSESEKGEIFDNPEEEEKYLMVTNFLESYVLEEQKVDSAREELQNKDEQEPYLAEIKNILEKYNWKNPEEMEIFLNVLQNGSSLRNPDAMRLISKNISLNEQSSFTNELTEVLDRKLDAEIEENRNINLPPEDMKDLPEVISIYIDNKSRKIDTTRLLSEFNNFKDKYSHTNLTPREIKNLFIESLSSGENNENAIQIISQLDSILDGIITRDENDAARKSGGDYLHDPNFWENYNNNFRENNLSYTPPKNNETSSDSSQNSENTENISSGNGKLTTTPSGREILYDGENITIQNGDTEIPISQEDLVAIQGPNKIDAETNIVNTYMWFIETVGSPGMYEYLPEIIGAMSDIGSDIQVNRADDSINDFERQKISQYILKIIHGKNSETSQLNGENNYELKLQEYANGGSELVERKSYGGTATDRFTLDLNKLGINRELSSIQIKTRLRKLANGNGILGEE